ncbi:hypothetical protein [Aliarcobacter butzleri]|uniref:hypothetical protein n=1 Tax=Aliarcobacter butzleri TaxID=28197 RepID=UPI003AFB5E8B
MVRKQIFGGGFVSITKTPKGTNVKTRDSILNRKEKRKKRKITGTIKETPKTTGNQTNTLSRFLVAKKKKLEKDLGGGG